MPWATAPCPGGPFWPPSWRRKSARPPFWGLRGEGYHTRNFTYAQLCIGTILGRIIVGKLFLKPYYDYKVVSIYEYLEKDSGS